jgi:tyrosine-specific transport protein
MHGASGWVCVIAEFFAFFAIATSFLGIALGLFDFLADGLKIKKEGMGKVILALLIAVPTMVFATQFERIFILALETSGGFGDSILNGLIPVLMVWVGRYRMGYLSHIQVPGGKLLLSLIFCFFLFSLLLEVMMQTGGLPTINVPVDRAHEC